MDIQPILQRVPQLASAKSIEVTELTGGITNKNYKITADGESFVLRMGGNETKHLGIDREVEYECSRRAAQAGHGVDRLQARLAARRDDHIRLRFLLHRLWIESSSEAGASCEPHADSRVSREPGYGLS